MDAIDWDVVLRGEVPYGDLSFRRKGDSEDFPNGLVFGIKGGIRFPEGFNSGHQVSLILDRVALPYSGIKSFDELPIPFACVGTDLVNSKAHTFRDGDLSIALRSTMSLPGVFTPVRDDKTVYVDGGLLDNLPVDVAKRWRLTSHHCGESAEQAAQGGRTAFVGGSAGPVNFGGDRSECTAKHAAGRHSGFGAT